jgi:hypothetical protein
MTGQGGEVEPQEADDVRHGWGECGQAFHARGQPGVTVAPIQPLPQRLLAASRKQPWIMNLVQSRWPLATLWE